MAKTKAKQQQTVVREVNIRRCEVCGEDFKPDESRYCIPEAADCDFIGECHVECGMLAEIFEDGERALAMLPEVFELVVRIIQQCGKWDLSEDPELLDLHRESLTLLARGATRVLEEITAYSKYVAELTSGLEVPREKP